MPPLSRNTLTARNITKRRALKEPVLNARRLNLENRLVELEQEIDKIAMEKTKHQNVTKDLRLLLDEIFPIL